MMAMVKKIRREVCQECLAWVEAEFKTYEEDFQYSGKYVKVAKIPREVIMLPVYLNVTENGKTRWQRVGLFCPVCHNFSYRNPEYFKRGKHAKRLPAGTVKWIRSEQELDQLREKVIGFKYGKAV